MVPDEKAELVTGGHMKVFFQRWMLEVEVEV